MRRGKERSKRKEGGGEERRGEEEEEEEEEEGGRGPGKFFGDCNKAGAEGPGRNDDQGIFFPFVC